MLQLKKETPPEVPWQKTDDLTDAEVTDRGPRIRCPKCAWQPRKSDLWSCTCTFSWNTFDTAGLCPGCGKQWEDTACLRCHEWSPHRDWYESTPDEP